MKKGIALIAALVLSVLLLGCEEAVTYATADDAKAALNGQGVISPSAVIFRKPIRPATSAWTAPSPDSCGKRG